MRVRAGLWERVERDQRINLEGPEGNRARPPALADKNLFFCLFVRPLRSEGGRAILWDGGENDEAKSNILLLLFN